MSRLLVPVALDVLVLRASDGAWADTRMAVPQEPPAGAPAQRQPLLPPPFTDLPAPRPPGAYLHWALADGLTALQPATERLPPRFRPVPSRWLILRLSGPAAPRRRLQGWLLPNVHDPETQVVSDILTRPDPIPVGPAPLPLTTAGFGELGWSAYYDNVTNRLGFHDPLGGVEGPVAYLICGWYTHTSLDPLAEGGPAVSEAEFRARLGDLGWYADGAVPAPLPDQSLYHGGAVGIAWPGTTWAGDGDGALSAEVGGPPRPDDVAVALGETIAAAVARLTTTDADPQTLSLLVEGLAQQALGELATADGGQRLVAALHATRFGDVPQPRRAETIYLPPEVLEAPRATTARRDLEGDGSARPGTLHDALGAATPDAGEVQTLAAASGDSTEQAGDLTTVSRSQPRLFHPVDPTLALEGAGRGYRHGGDGRFDSRGRLRCRYTAQTVSALGAPGATPPRGADVVPTWFAVDVPAEVHALLDELASLDPASAPDLAGGSTPSPIAAARAAWWVTWDRSDPAQPLPDPLPYTMVGVPPSPVAITPPSRPWTPLHLDWELDWRPSPRGARDWQLGEVDYQFHPDVAVPPSGSTMGGRAMLTPAPALLLASGAAQVTAALALSADPDALGRELDAALGATPAGIDAALADADLLAGSMLGFLDRVRGVPEGQLVVGDDATDEAPYPVTPLRAGFASLRRLRVVDTFGQVVYLLGCSPTTPVVVGRLELHPDLVVPGRPELIAQVPRFTAAARLQLRYTDALTGLHEVFPGQSPLAGLVVASPFDATLEFFDQEGRTIGRLRRDPTSGSAWEEAPGRPAALGRLPSQLIDNPALGALADGIVAFDTLAAARGSSPTQTALSSLLRVIDTTQWTVDQTGKAGDEHLALLLGNPVAVLRARLTLDVDDELGADAVERTAVAVRLGSLAHLDDGLLAYYVGDDFSRVHVVDHSVAELALSLPVDTDAPTAGEDPLSNAYVDDSGLLWVQPGQSVPLTLLVTPAADVSVTSGLLPQKTVGMRREWLAAALATLTPTLRFGPVLRDPKTTRLPLPTDVHGTWTWHRRPDPANWTRDSVVPATADALLEGTLPLLSEGWLRVTLIPEVTFPEGAVPIQVTCIDKPSEQAAIRAIGGTNRDGRRWRLPIAQAVEMVESGRFRFFVDVQGQRADIVVVVPPSGRKFLRTTFDTTTVNNLLSLPTCPPPP